jgi:hypothetical protein
LASKCDAFICVDDEIEICYAVAVVAVAVAVAAVLRLYVCRLLCWRRYRNLSG